MIYTNPINNYFIEYHLCRAFKTEFTVSNYPVLTDDTELITTSTAIYRISLDPTNWIKQQP